MKKFFLFAISFAILYGFSGCSRADGKIEPTEIQNVAGTSHSRMSASELAETLEIFRNDPDGTFYETLPEGYTPTLEGTGFHYVNVWVFRHHEGRISEIYEQDPNYPNDEPTVPTSGDKAWERGKAVIYTSQEPPHTKHKDCQTGTIEDCGVLTTPVGQIVIYW